MEVTSFDIEIDFYWVLDLVSYIFFCWYHSARMAAFARILSATISVGIVATCSLLPLTPILICSTMAALLGKG